ncbi:MAG TPA: nuclear transport factor 2 family protein [Steroidobacteraceae bacterium]|nr:nuclear transport factor 2 family protein [Steroidobacteraceae bacterium]
MNRHPIDVWHDLVRSLDPAGLDDLLGEKAVFFSPVVHTPQHGKAIVKAYLSAALKVFSNPTFRYVREIFGPSDTMLEFETEIDGVLVNGVDIIKWDGSGKIVEFKVMIRPLKAINLIHERMGAALAAASRPFEQER